jgi:hypothetical protein
MAKKRIIVKDGDQIQIRRALQGLDLKTGATEASKANLISPATLDNLVSQKVDGDIKDSGAAAANVPSTGQKAALAGTSGTPSGTNKYVTNDDTRNSNNRNPNAHMHVGADVTITGCGVIGQFVQIAADYSLEASGYSFGSFAEVDHNHDGTYCRWKGVHASDPTGPIGGDIYKNSGDGKVYLYDGSGWVALT